MTTTVDQIAARRANDEARLRVCATIEEAIEQFAAAHPGLSLREIATKLPPDEATRLLQMCDELELWSR